jgi:hypothetical protein
MHGHAILQNEKEIQNEPRNKGSVKNTQLSMVYTTKRKLIVHVSKATIEVMIQPISFKSPPSVLVFEIN